MKNGSKVWHCRKISEEGAEEEIFAKPKMYILRPNYLTIQPTGGFMDIMQYGDKVDKSWRGVANPYERWSRSFKEGDRWYLDGKEPNLVDGEEPDLGYGYDANAKTSSIRYQNVSIQFNLERI